MRRGIDHLVLCVADLERVMVFYRRLGFTTTPRAQHPWGTDNSLVQLEGCFLELLTVARPQLIPPPAAGAFGFGAFSRDFLARREGMSMLVFESADARADRVELAARGLAPYDVFDFEREATLPGGERVRVAFSLAFATDPRMPEAAFFCCQQHAPQYFWKPEYQAHANGALGIDEVFMAAPDPLALGEFFARVQEPDSVHEADDGLVVDTPRGRLRVLAPAAARERLALPAAPATPVFAGYSLRVPSIEPAAAILRANGVGFESRGGRLVISAADAHGVQVEIAPARS